MNLVKSMVGELHSETYEIQIETIRQARMKGFNIKEIPMIFVNRKKGKSKLTTNEIREFLSYIVGVELEGKHTH
jgi:dolichol-phosphate mannosyltransferase